MRRNADGTYYLPPPHTDYFAAPQDYFPPSSYSMAPSTGAVQMMPVSPSGGAMHAGSLTATQFASAPTPSAAPGSGATMQVVPPYFGAPFYNITHEAPKDAGASNVEDTKDVKAPDGEKPQGKRGALMPFVIISTSYLLYTMTDGSVRMIVLLHAYNKRFSAMEVALMFTLYETAGVVTNLLAGVAGAKWGIKYTLLSGLFLQFAGLGMLFGWRDDWDKVTAIIYVTIAQMLCGIAKDLTKLGGKTVTKLVTPDEKQGSLFRLVSYITGFKNSLKGVGYFIGAACLNASEEWGYYLALGVNVGMIMLAIPWAAVGLSPELGMTKSKNVTIREALFSTNYNLNWLSLARLFLFASRDLWFEVPLPFYLRAPRCDSIGVTCGAGLADCGGGTVCNLEGICENLNQGCNGLGLSRVLVGTFLGLYIIVYGQFQAFTPALVSTPLRQTPPNKWVEVVWGWINCLPPGLLGILILSSPAFTNEVQDETGMLATMIAGIAAFAIIFAINSSIHSYLVVRYADGNKVAQSVGFYYMSNAAGRLSGTLISGALYSYVGRGDGALADVNVGLGACFIAGTISSLLAVLITYKINDQEAGLACGSLQCIEGQEDEGEKKKGAGEE
mmetsp:Transcript_58044/g.138171  ORF Transcript_58044/g.138171 Transcript_58044/m.138171 type:complete len:615 (+) Transcript_58044:85-1929(+)|eukprot:CAMPEP_0180151842 /NCGR_PEP_ID=MMETSP0986-20121125/22391_1 /TAXON_ID=697907 /ORGANISM="non described non described, Strain CCMP2293" /LENGTH=614 /DNA_ID=CAMNT_0022099257 /DNA_START=36 /DNA_END=1880 /DNA_ORIENTATION=+